ncbi:MAG: hypothetical protein FWD67_02625 [Betaproteobacteria bacterium]|nr:hypothetical protein [Betaproteobacteria bacterium]
MNFNKILLEKLIGPDYLGELDAPDVAAWYRRLANWWPKNVPDLSEPLAGKLLNTWLNNRERNKVYLFEAPPHLRSLELKQVREGLIFHRTIFLTEKRAKNGKWGGILPRIQGLPGFQKWDMRGELALEYESLCVIGEGRVEINRIQTHGTSAERDILGAMHGFQLKSKCKVVVSPIPNSSFVNVRFKEWYVSITDDYHWDPEKGLTVPNPDYQSKDPKAVKPDLEIMPVHHSNAKRVEDAGMAAPFKVEIKPWQINDAGITREMRIDIKRRL